MKNQIAESISLWWSLRNCIFNKFPGDVDAAGMDINFENLSSTWMSHDFLPKTPTHIAHPYSERMILLAQMHTLAHMYTHLIWREFSKLLTPNLHSYWERCPWALLSLLLLWVNSSGSSPMPTLHTCGRCHLRFLLKSDSWHFPCPNSVPTSRLPPFWIMLSSVKHLEGNPVLPHISFSLDPYIIPLHILFAILTEAIHKMWSLPFS